MGNLFLTKLKSSQVKSSQVKPVVKGLSVWVILCINLMILEIRVPNKQQIKQVKSSQLCINSKVLFIFIKKGQKIVFFSVFSMILAVFRGEGGVIKKRSKTGQNDQKGLKMVKNHQKQGF